MVTVSVLLVLLRRGIGANWQHDLKLILHSVKGPNDIHDAFGRLSQEKNSLKILPGETELVMNFETHTVNVCSLN